MLHIRLFYLSNVSLAMAGGVALWNLPQPAGALLGGSIALASLAMLGQRDGLREPPRRTRNTLAPFESARELTREADAATPLAPANGNLTPYQAGRSDFRLAPVTDHAFGRGDQVEFIFDSWEEGELTFSGKIEECFRAGFQVRVLDGESYLVGREYLVLVEAAQ